MKLSLLSGSLAIFTSLSLAVASPTPEPVTREDGLEERTTPLCTTVASGILSTSEVAIGWPYKKRVLGSVPFALNSNNEIAFYNTTKPTITAEFQKCTPNYYGASNDGTAQDYLIQYWGRVYIPSLKACIGIENPDDYSMFLYFPKVVPCLSSASGQMSTAASIPQNFAYRNWNGRKEIFWTGSSTKTPPTYQGWCETGLLGYFQWLPNGYPRVGTNNRVQYVCNADSENAVAAAQLV